MTLLGPLAHLNDRNTMLIVGIGMILLVAMRFLLRPKTSNRRYESPNREEKVSAHMLDAPTEVGRWEVQMHETARNLMGELNTKIVIVEQLVRDANQAAERLERAIERAENK
jgi:hypothetical protein